MKCLIQTEYQLCCSGAQRHMCFTSFSLKLSRVWYSISCRHPYVTEPFQKVLCFYFKGCLNWIAASVCRTLPPLCGLHRKKTGRKGNALVLFVYIVASVREIILFCFVFREYWGFWKCEFFKEIFLPEMLDLNDEGSEEDIGNSQSSGIAITQWWVCGRIRCEFPGLTLI